MAIYFSATKEWVEVASSGELLGRWSVPIPAGAFVDGIALTASGSVFLSASVPDAKKNPRPAVYEFGKQTGNYWN
jgi:hypothetical protein